MSDDVLIAALDYTPVELLDAWIAVVNDAVRIAEGRTLDALAKASPAAPAAPEKPGALPDVPGAPNIMKQPRTPPPGAVAGGDEGVEVWPYRHTPQKRVLEWVKDEMHRRNKDGASAAELARDTGVNYETVRQILAQPRPVVAEAENPGFGPAMPGHLLDAPKAPL